MGLMRGRYEVEDEPSHGGQMGAGFLGRDRVLERDVVVKRVSNPAEAKREALALAAVAGHGAMLAVFDLFEVDGAGYIVTERVRGKPLGRDEAGKPRDRREAVEVTLSVLRALRHMHDLGYLHTDVKPRNILLTDGHNEERVKLVDFGGAVLKTRGRFRGCSGAGCHLSMAPEQFDGVEAVLDDSSDLYQAAGVCVYLLTGHSPIAWPKRSGSEKETTARCRALQEAGHRHEITDRELDQVLRRALDRDRGKRYRKAQDLIDALRQFAD